MRLTSRMRAAALGAAMLASSQISLGQQTDCNALARDFVAQKYDAGSTQYSKLLFLSVLTQMNMTESTKALERAGKVSVGPISIGPASWNEAKRDETRSMLQKLVNIEQLNQSAASISITSGSPEAAKVVSDCIGKGGFFVSLSEIDANAVARIVWVAPAAARTTATIASVSVVNGKAVGGLAYTKTGAVLNDKLEQLIVIERRDPKRGLAVVVNTKDAGSGQAYLPPSELPPPLPPRMVTASIDGDPVEVGSGGKYENYENPCPQSNRSTRACVRPQHGGKIVVGSGRPTIKYSAGRTGTRDPALVVDEYCITFWSGTAACEHEAIIKGFATATEQFEEGR